MQLMLLVVFKAAGQCGLGQSRMYCIEKKNVYINTHIFIPVEVPREVPIVALCATFGTIASLPLAI